MFPTFGLLVFFFLRFYQSTSINSISTVFEVGRNSVKKKSWKKHYSRYPPGILVVSPGILPSYSGFPPWNSPRVSPKASSGKSCRNSWNKSWGPWGNSAVVTSTEMPLKEYLRTKSVHCFSSFKITFELPRLSWNYFQYPNLDTV